MRERGAGAKVAGQPHQLDEEDRTRTRTSTSTRTRTAAHAAAPRQSDSDHVGCMWDEGGVHRWAD